jgi:hypothetical protein
MKLLSIILLAGVVSGSSVIGETRGKVEAVIREMIRSKYIIDEYKRYQFDSGIESVLLHAKFPHKTVLSNLYYAWLNGDIQITEYHLSQIQALFNSLSSFVKLQGVTEELLRETVEVMDLYNDPHWKPLMVEICEDFIRVYCRQPTGLSHSFFGNSQQGITV